MHQHRWHTRHKNSKLLCSLKRFRTRPLLVIKSTALTHRPRARHSITALHTVECKATHTQPRCGTLLVGPTAAHTPLRQPISMHFNRRSAQSAWKTRRGMCAMCVCATFIWKYALNRRYKVSFFIRTVVILCVLIKAFGSVRNESKRAIENFVPWKIEVEICVPVQMLSATSETSVRVVSAQNYRIFSAKECLIFLIWLD